MTAISDPMRDALKAVQFRGHQGKCPLCAGWGMSPYGETPGIHTKDCLIAAALASPPLDREAWRPIASAPKDGTTIIIGRWSDIFGFVMGYAYWEGGDSKISGWISQGFCQTTGNLGLGAPTHWQPLPVPPESKEG